MSLVLSGDGSITGLSAGGLPDNSITAAELADGIITRAKVSTSEADSFAFCRAWVNFNGTGTVAIRADFNVSSITDNGTGNYTVNFTTAMPDADYVSAGFGGGSSDGAYVSGETTIDPTTTALAIRTGSIPGVFGPRDLSRVYVAVFR